MGDLPTIGSVRADANSQAQALFRYLWAMAEKLSQRAVNYRDGTKQKNCGNCDMYREGQPPSCTRVVGPIRKNGLCNIWETKE